VGQRGGSGRERDGGCGSHHVAAIQFYPQLAHALPNTKC
jgi:hypothetical protein